MSLKLFGTVTKGQELHTLFLAQEGRCFYTGEVLIPGKNAGIDHQIPVRRGGPVAIQNLRWVTIQINRVKNDLTHEEFLKLCYQISQRFQVS